MKTVVGQMLSPKESAKAYVAAFIAMISFAVPVVDDGLVISEILGIILAGLVAFQGTFWVTNKTNVSGTGVGTTPNPH